MKVAQCDSKAGDLPNPGIEPRSPALLADSLPAESQRKPKSTEVCSLSLREGNGTPLQYSCLENPMDGGPGGLQAMGSLRVGHN